MLWRNLLVLVGSVVLLSSCEKKEKPYPIPVMPELGDSVKEDQVALGADYETQVYYSLTNGFVSGSEYKVWDISFTTGATDNEMWMNGGKLNLLYVTDANQLADINASFVLDNTKWGHDKSRAVPNTSFLGLLDNNAAVGKVWLMKVGADIYKFRVKSITADAVTIETAKGLDGTTVTEYVLNKDENYNFVFFNFETGIVTPEPPKKDWDLLFTRYRYVYEGYNTDGSDFLYGVTGVLHNPYNTTAGADSNKQFDYFTFTKDTFETYFSLTPNRDAIGWNWKSVDINTGIFVVLTKRVYVIKDQNDVLWKLHFLSFVNDMGVKGHPKFRYEKL